MKLYRKITLFLLLVSSSSIAQQTTEFNVLFQNGDSQGNFVYSEIFAVSHPAGIPFTGISAYCMEPGLEIDLYYRIKVQQQWQEWVVFQPVTEGHLDDRAAFEGKPIEQAFEAIQFKANNTVNKPFVFRLYFPDPEKKSPEFTGQKTAACNCPQPNYCDRSCWCPGGNCPPDPTPSPTAPTHIIVHHSAGFNSSTDFKAVVAYYWDLHVNTNGWDDIGYNWLIDANGVIYEARGNGIAGAHFSCMNSHTTGICLIGDFTNTNPSVAAVNSLVDLAAWECCNKNIKPDSSSLHSSSQLVLNHISGHLDGNTSTQGCPSGTVCPGNMLYTQLGTIADDVAGKACFVSLRKEILSDLKLDIYPNPAKEELIVEGNLNSEYSIAIYTITGKQIYQSNNIPEGNSFHKKISLNNLSRGTYICRFKTGEHTVNRLLVKE